MWHRRQRKRRAVVSYCNNRFASARVFAKQLQARCQSAILAALASNARHQQQKRHLEQRATDLRRRKLLTLCLRFWRVWVGYQRLLNRTAAAVESGIRRRMLQQVMNQWRGLVQYKAWQKEACETAEGFYWCRWVMAHSQSVKLYQAFCLHVCICLLFTSVLMRCSSAFST